MSDPPTLFTPPERELIRREFMVRWNAARPLTEGIGLKRWATGPSKGQVKVSAVVRSMLERGLVSIVDNGDAFPSARFTEAGWRALRAMAADPRQLNPRDYAHILADLDGVEHGR